ncbi:MAG: DUF1214 domain-containing protein [Bacteroidota bacterium]
MKNIILPFFFSLSMAGVGAFIAFQQLKSSGLNSSQVLHIGSWILPPKMDLSDHMEARARVALTALFALRESEVLYAVANKDTQGEALDGRYSYRVSGSAPDARYWSITLYGEDLFLIPNEANRYNINGQDVQYDQRGAKALLFFPGK